MITVFCVRRAGEAAPVELAGPGGAPVQLIEEGPLGAWVCDGVAAAGVETVRAHDAIVRRALRSSTPLPARFGTVFVDERELRRSLREREDELLEGLNRIAGRVEMGVRVEWGMELPREEKRPVAGGRGYLEARRKEFEAEDALRAEAALLLDEIERRIAPEASERVRTLLPESSVAGTVAHLVHRHAAGLYRKKVEAARPAFPHVNLRLTGPWAPYSFV